MQQLRRSKRYMVPLLLLAACFCCFCCCWPPVAGALGGCSYGYTSKSIPQAYLECLQYLNVSRQPLAAYDETADGSTTAPGGNCLVRCIGLTTRWWDDDRMQVREPALLRHFRLNISIPATERQLEKARTCVETSTKALVHGTTREEARRCRAAYQSFRCYSDALGELVAHARYLPPRTEELLGAVRDCAELLQLPGHRVARYVARSFLRDADGTRLLRCIVLKLGLYTDTKGVLAERLLLLPGAGTVDPASWSPAKAKQCEQSVRDLGTDVCYVATHSIEHCYGREAFGDLWPLMAEQYIPEDTMQQQQWYVHGEGTLQLPTSSTPKYSPLRSKLVYLRKHQEQGGDRTVPFEMLIADSDYRDIAQLLESDPVPSVKGTELHQVQTDSLTEHTPTETEHLETTQEEEEEEEQLRKPRSSGDNCDGHRCPDTS